MDKQDNGPVAPTEPIAQSGLTASAQDALNAKIEWFIYENADLIGPFTRADMQDFVISGRLTPTSEVTRRAAPDWKQASADSLLMPLLESHRIGRAASIQGPLSIAQEPPLVTIWPKASGRNTTTIPIVVKSKTIGVDQPAPLIDPFSESQPFKSATKEKWPFSAVKPKKRINLNPPITSGKALGSQRIFARKEPALPETVKSPNLSPLISLIVPGIGQLENGQPLKAGVLFGLTLLAWTVGFGWIFHIWAGIDAWRNRKRIISQKVAAH